jgi:hypothetical protein
MTRIARVVSTAAMALICLLGTAAQAQFEDLIRHVPETATAVVLVDADAMFSSQIAKAENWQANRVEHFAAGMTSIPPLAKSLVIAAELDPHAMRAKWEVAVAQVDTSTKSMSDYAKQVGGSLDQLGPVQAVRLPDDSFLLQFPDGMLGAMAPGDRQKAGYWINRPNRGMSPFLTETISDLDSDAHIVMAMDLTHAFSADDLQRGMEKFDAVKQSQVNLADLAKFMATITGVTLEISFRDKTYGKLSLDFAEDAAIVSKIAKPLMLETLGAYGVTVDEVSDWQPEVVGSRISLSGTLTDNGLMRISSLIHLPTPALHQTARVSSASGQKKSQLELTQQYLASVTMLLDNLGHKKHTMTTMGQLAQWCDSYSQKVSHLPTLGVDKEMLAYGKYIEMQLHNVCYALKGIGIQESVAEVNAAGSSRIYGGALGNISQDNWQSGGYYGGGGGANYGRRVETNAAYGVARHFGVEGAVKSGIRQAQTAVTTVRFQSRAQAGTYIQQTISNMELANDQIRESMTDKYQVQFE